MNESLQLLQKSTTAHVPFAALRSDMEDVSAESFAMIARREELKFKHQSAVADAIETVTHDTETCQSGRALAGLPFGR